MKNLMNLKLAVMSIVSSSCLISAAHAEVEVTGAQLSLTQVDHHHYDYDDAADAKNGHHHSKGILPVACGSDSFKVKYKLKNISEYDAVVYDIDHIAIGLNDSYPDDETIVTVLGPTKPLDCGSQGVPFELDGAHHNHGEFCFINIEINPRTNSVQEDCDADIFDPGSLIDRTLIVDAYVDFGGAKAPVTFPITTLGSAETLSILGNNICDTTDDNAYTPFCDGADNDSPKSGISNVRQNVAVYGDGNPPFYKNGFITELLSGYPRDYKRNDEETERFINDSESAYRNLNQYANNYCPDAVEYPAHLTSDINGDSAPITIEGDADTPTVICIARDNIVQIDNTITLKGNGIYVFYVQPLIEDPEPLIKLSIIANANMDLACDDVDPTDCAESGDIYWVVDGLAVVDPNSPIDNPNPDVPRLYGTFLLDNGGFEFNQSVSMGTNLIGRILAFDGDNVIVDATTVTEPEDDVISAPDSI